MAEFAAFCQLARAQADSADFVVIYVQEAHPADGWWLGGNPYAGASHKTNAERCKAAEDLLVMDPPCPLLADTVDDCADKQFGCYPERLYVLKDGKVAYKGGQGPNAYNFPAAREFLLANL